MFIPPMLASLADAPLDDADLVYEPKYDGIRAIAEVAPARAGAARARARGWSVRLWSRLGNDKTSQFPEIVAALERWAQRVGAAVVLDGEIVALDQRGEPTGFQQLQGRIQRGRETLAQPEPHERFPVDVAFVVFDLLREDTTDLRDRPLLERRARLERLFPSKPRSQSVLRMSQMARGSGRALYARALASGWEGLIAKRADSPYRSGKRTPEWRKLKIVCEQEFAIGGWTEPRNARSHFGALLLGVFGGRVTRPGRGRSPNERGLVHVGQVGTGFDQRELERVMKRLRPLQTSACPFRDPPRTSERPHWVRPELVAQVKFTEWTDDGKLRHPVFLGLRDDKDARQVRREPQTRLHATSVVRLKPDPAHEAAAAVDETGGAADSRVLDQLREIEESHRDGIVDLPGGRRLAVTNLHKVFWPRQRFTKGDLFRYYVQVAPFILPVLADRPLVMKRFPNGVRAKPFYQHRVLQVPAGVRVEQVAAADHRPQIVGGDLMTLLHTTQLAAISQDPWFSRVQSPQRADYVALDLDPMPGITFARVRDVARWVRDELHGLGATGIPKTSGSEGLHVYIPLPPDTPYEAGLLFCQIVATLVSQKHPKAATVERSLAARGTRVYVDYLQNALGKTLAAAYSARASEYAGVSSPLAWRELDEGVRREDFTIQSVPARLRERGDLWKALRESKGVDLARAARYAARVKR